ncbi:hypothetical protein [Luteibacter sp. 9135]|uniref:hypothetical protein n=1 Tax=Luteibacter sp. 9135 TaxID=1500893 RepID=UPI00068F1981|nr:hypothetical protein [Luteibacter sp. 9135]
MADRQIALRVAKARQETIYPRGGEPIGFDDKPVQCVTGKSVRVASDVSEASTRRYRCCGRTAPLSPR